MTRISQSLKALSTLSLALSMIVSGDVFAESSMLNKAGCEIKMKIAKLRYDRYLNNLRPNWRSQAQENAKSAVAIFNLIKSAQDSALNLSRQEIDPVKLWDTVINKENSTMTLNRETSHFRQVTMITTLSADQADYGKLCVACKKAIYVAEIVPILEFENKFSRFAFLIKSLPTDPETLFNQIFQETVIDKASFGLVPEDIDELLNDVPLKVGKSTVITYTPPKNRYSFNDGAGLNNKPFEQPKSFDAYAANLLYRSDDFYTCVVPNLKSLTTSRENEAETYGPYDQSVTIPRNKFYNSEDSAFLQNLRNQTRTAAGLQN